MTTPDKTPITTQDSTEPINAPEPTKRVFQIGATRIPESVQMIGKSNEDVRGILQSMYPEIKDATIQEQVHGDTTVVRFKAKAGRRG